MSPFEKSSWGKYHEQSEWCKVGQDTTEHSFSRNESMSDIYALAPSERMQGVIATSEGAD